MSRYSYSDPSALPVNVPFVSVTQRYNPLLNIFRMLSGTVKCNDTYINKTTRFKRNYFKIPAEDINSTSLRMMLSNFPEEVKASHLNNYFRYTSSNTAFYIKLEKEIVKCLLAVKKGKALEAYIHLYRTLELISYSLPLIYTSKSKEFLKSFESLKNFMIATAKGSELKFFENFLKICFGKEDFFSTSIDINFNRIKDEDLKAKYYRLFNKLSDDNDISDSTENEEIKYTFIGYYNLIICLRNRYFHLRQGDWVENISSSEVEYPELFFDLIVDKAINWVAIIIFEIIKFDFNNHDY